MFGIKVMTEICRAYTMKYDTEIEAKEAAVNLSREFRTDVMVYHIIGTFTNTTIWKPEEVKDETRWKHLGQD